MRSNRSTIEATSEISPRHDHWRFDVMIAVIGLSILGLTIAASLHFAKNSGEQVTRNTMRLCFACYVAALIGMTRLGPADWPAQSTFGRGVRWCWTFANLYFLAHVTSAFQFYHHWSHREAFESTRAISGVGEGLYISYFFTLIWTADVAAWWLAPRWYAHRSKWISRPLHIFMAFIIFNGTVVFESGWTRVAGIIAFAVVAALWFGIMSKMKLVLLRRSPVLILLLCSELLAAPTTTSPAPTGFEYIDTSFENASPLWYEFAADGTILINQLYDQERNSPNRASGHFHFALLAKRGSKLTLEFRNLDDIYNGKIGSVAKEMKALVVSEDGKHWRSLATEVSADNRVRITLEMPGPRLYVARAEPYRISDLDRLLSEIRENTLVQITPIGKTVQGRQLEIIRVGDEHAPYRVFIRARAHSWEPVGNWVVQGLIHRLLKKDADAERGLKQYCVWILPMANKDGVARGRSRFNVNGMDLNRNWDKPANPELAPENAALEGWLEGQIQHGLRPHLALELHNDGHGNLHIKAPAALSPEATKRYVDRMTTLEGLLKKKTWFTEGASHQTPARPMTLAEGFLARYQIDGAVHEFNCYWIEGLHDFANGAHWETYGAELCDVFSAYFEQVKP